MSSKNHPDANIQGNNVSRRDFIKVSVGGSMLLCLPSWGQSAEKPGEWWYVQISDTHSAGDDHAKTLKLVLDDIVTNFPQAKFVLNTGDVTEHGWEEELDRHCETTKDFSLPLFEVMGNHDSRWSRAGRYAYRNRIGGTHWAIEHPNLSIFALDCSVLMEQHGHLDPTELAWLEENLKREPGKPAVVGFHHPPCTTGRYLDTDGDLFQLLAQHNVPAILAGHVHRRNQFQVNGTWVITSGAAMTPKSGYCVFRVRPDEMTLFNRQPEAKETTEVLSIPLRASLRGQPSPSDVILKPKVQRDQVVVSLPKGFSSEATLVQVNGHEQPSQSIKKKGNASIAVDTDQLAAGFHELELISPSVEAKEQKRAWGRFDIKAGRDIGLRWQQALPAGIQTRPAFWKDLVIVGTNDGSVQAFSIRSGRQRWSYDSGPDAVLSSPAIRGDRVYFGTMDGHVVCLIASSGKLGWKRKVEGSVFAGGTFAGTPEHFIVGTGKGILYALSPVSGATKWTYQAGNHIKATPAYDGKRLFFGAWDGCFYALDANTGQEAWKLKIQSPHFSAATSNPQVYKDRVLVVTHNYRTHCLDVETGKHLWAYPALDVKFKWNGPVVEKCKPSYSSAIFYDGVAYFGSLTGHVVGFDLDSGKQVFELALDDETYDSFPILVGDRFYFGTIGGTLQALNLKTKKVDMKYSLGPHFIFAPPASDGQYLAIGSLAGQFACLKV